MKTIKATIQWTACKILRTAISSNNRTGRKFYFA